MRRVLLGVSASVAAYKAADLCRRLVRDGGTVQVMMTPDATRLIAPATFQALSGRPVMVDEWLAPHSEDGMDHIAASREADCFLVAPASADFISKAAAGNADNLLLAAFLAADCPRFVAPAMNQQMWRAETTRRNVQRLADDGVGVLGPDEGEQACGEEGAGRLLEPVEIVRLVRGSFPLAGQRIVVSTGATVEPIDGMRVITNRSSGRMGYCLAVSAYAMGADVRIVAAQTTVAAPAHIPLRRAVDGEAMRVAMLAETEGADWFFSVAAVADFRPERVGVGKTARVDGGVELSLVPTADILATVVRERPGLRCLGFAAGAGEGQEVAAREKMRRKGVEFMVVNDLADAGAEDCQLALLYPEGAVRLPRLPKEEAARRLLCSLVDVSHETVKEKL